ncbi:hypothetical protein GPECTOR_20g430 [Gonium pectorale]|uniref:Uncharacterized protein n=1 Tax=Gonium pectorale TaxID=33097 RepID=A0A150GIP8_GONPE|nr:hypothetical protein GPECTOR_20g430 [Gonium pectorale]|eukprot:KXZ49575.1 hypothetical protein GPECTOR_20g430 [Gonium pectorale]
MAVAAEADSDGGGGGAAAAVPRLKRLLREAFAELSDLRARLDEAEAGAAEAAESAEAAEALVLPLEGFAVRPYSRALSADLRLRCRAQVSGQVEAPLLLPLLAFESGEAAPALGDADAGYAAPPAADWGAALREAGLAPALRASPPSSSSPSPSPSHSAASPRLRLRIQSIWGGQEPLPGGGGGSGGGGSGGGSQGQGSGSDEAAPRAAAAHLQLSSDPGGGSLAVDKLLVKVEAHPRLRLLLATHGSLNNIAKNVNPFAAGAGHLRGLTEPMRAGHDLTLLAEGGAGAAVAVASGNLSAAFGSFTSASAAASHSEGCSGSGRRVTSCAQLSLHRSRALALSAAWAASAPAAPGLLDGLSAGGGGDDGPAAGSSGGSLLPGPAALAGSAEDGRIVSMGLVGAWQLGERLNAAAWLGSSGSPDSAASPPAAATAAAAAPAGGVLSALGEHTRPGQGEGLAAGRWRQRRVGLRLATRPDEESGRSCGLCISHRGGTAASGGGRSGLLLVEASAALPLAHGLLLQPGLLLVRASRGGGGDDGCGAGSGGGGLTALCAAAQATWSF